MHGVNNIFKKLMASNERTEPEAESKAEAVDVKKAL